MRRRPRAAPAKAMPCGTGRQWPPTAAASGALEGHALWHRPTLATGDGGEGRREVGWSRTACALRRR
nr:unnamed protein product [Digitaria exilis]